MCASETNLNLIMVNVFIPLSEIIHQRKIFERLVTTGMKPGEVYSQGGSVAEKGRRFDLPMNRGHSAPDVHLVMFIQLTPALRGAWHITHTVMFI